MKAKAVGNEMNEWKSKWLLYEIVEVLKTLTAAMGCGYFISLSGENSLSGFVLKRKTKRFW